MSDEDFWECGFLLALHALLLMNGLGGIDLCGAFERFWLVGGGYSRNGGMRIKRPILIFYPFRKHPPLHWRCF